ncbi:nose resistant to fluoxetine protein 6-like [Thrips palmi]|uniref:Nose resistant to fluoxetine protein 6-like n=1 Tax=Thrips palmi TaxID=161013 RepID=A0A6P8Y423_THRPL|nr:nose resistant to fluoxetine protein 6-like [Thrips palmi]
MGCVVEQESAEVFEVVETLPGLAWTGADVDWGETAVIWDVVDFVVVKTLADVAVAVPWAGADLEGRSMRTLRVLLERSFALLALLQCMAQTWFTATLLQMFLFTPPLMWLVSRWTQRALWPGCLLLGLLLAACAVALYATTVQLGLAPTLLVFPRMLPRQAFLWDPTFVYQYVRAHTNAVPYVVGLLTGTLFHLADRNKWQPSKRTATWLWLGIPLGLLLLGAAFISAFPFVRPSYEARPLLDAAYGPARLLGFSLPAAWIIFTCGLGYGGMFDSILSWSPLVALGRLTFSVFLVHLAIIIVSMGSMRQPVHLSDFSVASETVADIAMSYAAGLLLYLCVEAPMLNLQTIFFSKLSSKRVSAERVLRDEPTSGKAQGAAEDGNKEHGDAAYRTWTSTTDA